MTLLIKKLKPWVEIYRSEYYKYSLLLFLV
jgi:hypothetical protein